MEPLSGQQEVEQESQAFRGDSMVAMVHVFFSGAGILTRIVVVVVQLIVVLLLLSVCGKEPTDSFSSDLQMGVVNSAISVVLRQSWKVTPGPNGPALIESSAGTFQDVDPLNHGS